MHRNYLNRMLTARDPRCRKIAEKLGYRTQAVGAYDPEVERERLRANYRRLTGKAADKRWSDATLLAKLLEAQS
jgi:hypothetical protein